MRSELDVVLRLDVATRAAPGVRGSVESRYGTRSFSGWLDLLGLLEGLVDRAHEDISRDPAAAPGDPATGRAQRQQPSDG